MNATMNPELLAGFVEEVQGYLSSIRREWREWRAAPGTIPTFENSSIATHTIKGAAAMLGFNSLSHLGFAFERVLEAVSQKRISQSDDLSAAVGLALDRIENYLHSLQSGQPADETLNDATRLFEECLDDPDSIRLDGRDVGLTSSSSAETRTDLPLWSQSGEETKTDLPALFDSDLAELPSFDLPDAFSNDTLSTVDSFPESLPAPVSESIPLPDISGELLSVFRAEADDLLRVLMTRLSDVRSAPRDQRHWLEIRRAAHTLKGSAAMVGFRRVTQLAHAMEDQLDEYYEGTRSAQDEDIALLLEATDAIEDLIAGRETSGRFDTILAQFHSKPDSAEPTESEPAIESGNSEPAIEEPQEVEAEPVMRAADAADSSLVIRVPMERLSEFSNLVGEQVITRSVYEQRMIDFSRLLSELQASATRLRRASDRLEASFETSTLGGQSTSKRSDEFDDLEMDRYTDFHLVSRELAETATDLQTISGEFGNTYAEFEGYLNRQSRLTSELEEKLTRLRMVPLSSIASKLSRTIRNAASTSGKEAKLILEGERTGLDKTVLEALADTFLHVLRNAVDHGLEPTEVRQALGKPIHGTVRVRAEQVGSHFQLTIQDDGRGIDPEIIRETALQRGLISKEQSETIDTKAVYDLLFLPGFSTKADITELSGRGVGLDVVKSKVTSLKGSIEVQSKVGVGTSFIIRLPLTLAVMNALLVKVQSSRYAISLECVDQILRFDEVNVERIGTQSFIRFGERVYPIVRLAEQLNLDVSGDAAVERPPVLLIRVGHHHAAVIVDSLVGGREIVVKRLGPMVQRNRLVSGATVMGDGAVVLILSPDELIRVGSGSTPLVTRPVNNRSREKVSVLIVDDSPSVRRVLASLIERNGWAVRTAKDGMEALELLQQDRVMPDIVLTDVEMPRMDGYELLGTLKGQASTQHIPVVVITSRAASRHRKKAMDLGASAYVVKPYQDESLTEIVRQLTHVSSSATANGAS